MFRVRRLTAALVVLLVAAAAAPAVAEEVILDPTFSSDGKVYVNGPDSVVLSLARDAGDIYVAGHRDSSGSADRQVPFVARLDDSGALDVTFSGDGLKSVAAVGGRFWVTGITVDDGGRVVLVAQSASRMVVVRFTTDGRLDDSFSGDGMREFNGGVSPIDLFPLVDIDSQERLVVAAMVELDGPGGADVVVRRLRPNGALDSSWSVDGVKTLDNGHTDWIEGLVVDDQDRVLIGSEIGLRSPASIYRFRPNGTRDPSFSDDGVTTFRFQPRQNTFPLGIGITGDGGITVAASTCCNSQGTTYGTARFQTNGDLDLSYGDRGLLGLTCLDCFPTWGDVDGGRVAIVTDPYQSAGLTRLVRVRADGAFLAHQSVDIFPGTTSELVFPVEIDGPRTLVGGQTKKGAFVARIP